MKEKSSPPSSVVRCAPGRFAERLDDRGLDVAGRRFGIDRGREDALVGQLDLAAMGRGNAIADATHGLLHAVSAFGVEGACRAADPDLVGNDRKAVEIAALQAAQAQAAGESGLMSRETMLCRAWIKLRPYAPDPSTDAD